MKCKIATVTHLWKQQRSDPRTEDSIRGHKICFHLAEELGYSLYQDKDVHGSLSCQDG